MENINERLSRIENLISSQGVYQKEVLNFNEAADFLDVSKSHLYKLTSSRRIPHFCPQGKKLYFNRLALESWLQQKQVATTKETVPTIQTC